MIEGFAERAGGRTNRPRRWTRTCMLLAATALLSTLSTGWAADDEAADFSQANQLLFMTDHLDNVKTPARLEYQFSRVDESDAFDDRIDLTVRSGDKEGKRVHVDFLTGDRNRHVPDIDNAQGNPVIMMFLQNDVADTARRTGGNWRYLQRRIKFALENGATVKQETAEYDGRQIDVKRIYLAPFAQEKAHRGELAEQMDKRYVFTLSDEVPGGVLEMRSEVPASEPGQQDMTDRLSLESIDHTPAESKQGASNT